MYNYSGEINDKKSIVTKVGILIKRLTGIRNLTEFRKKLKKECGKLIWLRSYTADELVNLMQEMGMKEGSIVCIHSSMREFYNYKGSAQELIEKIMQVITPNGTLLMPAYSFQGREQLMNPDLIFDPQKDKTIAGYLAETFRKMEGVRRSINVRHSVCAWGRYANYLICDHHKGRNCWDEYSPWYRLCELGGLVFTLGLPRSFMGTFNHCVEGLLAREHPYWAQFFNKRMTYRYRDEHGQIQSYTSDESFIERRTHKRVITRHFGSDIYKIRRISNLEIKLFQAQPCLNIMLELGRKGISMYYVPKPLKSK
ncbi:MAG: AAC(3) family N-acetyltransferase [Bacteroidales bacterium]|nr:AAC(3) family N-acetyltransferase [Bacteroidales bacterium]